MERRKLLFLLPVLVAAGLGVHWMRPAGAVGYSGGVSLVAVGSGCVASGAAEVKEGTSWMTIEEAGVKLQKEKRPVLIDLYTTWCGWCKQMDRKTYSNGQVARYLGDKYYTVKVDAESRGDLTWEGKVYHYNPKYRCNELALYLSRGRLEFPTTVIIVPGGDPQAIPGYMEPKELELLAKYFGEGAYKTQSFEAFQKGFKASW